MARAPDDHRVEDVACHLVDGDGEGENEERVGQTSEGKHHRGCESAGSDGAEEGHEAEEELDHRKRQEQRDADEGQADRGRDRVEGSQQGGPPQGSTSQVSTVTRASSRAGPT